MLIIYLTINENLIFYSFILIFLKKYVNDEIEEARFILTGI